MRNLLAYLVKSWKLIAVLSFCGMVLAFGFTWFFIPPKYQATATIYVLGHDDTALDVADLRIGFALSHDYSQVFRMWEVHKQVIENLHLPYSISQMQKMVSVRDDMYSCILDITVTSTDPKEAAEIANEYVRVSSDFIAKTLSTDRPNTASIALVPTKPSSPNFLLNIGIGLLVGAAAGVGIAVQRSFTDGMIRTDEDVRAATGLVTLAVVPREDPNDPKVIKANQHLMAERSHAVKLSRNA